MAARSTPSAADNIGVFISGTWVALAVATPGVVGEWAAYPLLAGLLLIAIFNRMWVNRVFFADGSDRVSKELVHALMTTVVLGLPLMGVLSKGLST